MRKKIDDKMVLTLTFEVNIWSIFNNFGINVEKRASNHLELLQEIFGDFPNIDFEVF